MHNALRQQWVVCCTKPRHVQQPHSNHRRCTRLTQISRRGLLSCGLLVSGLSSGGLGFGLLSNSLWSRSSSVLLLGAANLHVPR